LRFVQKRAKIKKQPIMRKRFEPQLILGQLPINETPIPLKNRGSLTALGAALKEIFVQPEWNEKIFNILEQKILSNKAKTGRPGMNLWQIFVLAQVRLCQNISYDDLHDMANHHSMIRHLMGVETEFGYEKIKFEYQNILDNVGLLDNATVLQLNDVIVEFGHSIFKKKEEEALRLKTDSFVVESNVHFPTDYNLLFDCARKSIDLVSKFLKKYPELPHWRKINNWQRSLKGMMRNLGRANVSGGRNKEKRVKEAAKNYLSKATCLSRKLEKSKAILPMADKNDILLHLELDRFVSLLDKHIDLVNRRLIKGEKIPHEEKMFSIFEEYTEWISKGKSHPNVELGKNTAITTDHFGLILDYHIMDHETDSQIIIPIANRLVIRHKISSWSFDKGFWHPENKQRLTEFVPQVIMPKKGKRNKSEQEQESLKSFKLLKNKHSAVESNINELEHCGLDRCPDRGYEHFKRYIGLAVCAYNLKRIGKKLLALEIEKNNLLQRPYKFAS